MRRGSVSVAGRGGRCRAAGTVRVLGRWLAWDGGRGPIALKGPRHRAVLARLIVARRRVVPVARLVEDLWADPPAGRRGRRTHLRRPRCAAPWNPSARPAPGPAAGHRGPRVRAARGAGRGGRLALRDGRRRRRDAAARGGARPAGGGAGAGGAVPRTPSSPTRPGPAAERSRLAELRLQAVERRAEARLALGRAAEAVPDLDAHVTEHPWREDAWRLLALALYRTGRQGDALAVLRRARTLLVDQLGWTRARACAAWKRTSSPRPRPPRPRRTARRGARRPGVVGAGGRRLRPHGRRPAPAPGWSRRWACCATSR